MTTRLAPLPRSLSDRALDAGANAIWRARWLLAAAIGFVLVFDITISLLPPLPGASVTVEMPAPIVTAINAERAL